MIKLKSDFYGLRPLLISTHKAKAHLSSVDAFMASIKDKKLDDATYGVAEAFFGQQSSMMKVYPLAIIHLKGVIGKNLPEMDRITGGCDLQEIEEMLEDAKADPNIKGLLLHVDSPGGCSVGVPEIAKKVREFGKPTTGVVDNEANSAGYWILSQCDQVYATRSASVGSVGVFIAFVNSQKAYEMNGLEVQLIRAGTLKGMGIEGLPLDEGQLKVLQDDVVEIWNYFKADVTAVRTLVEETSMQGQPFSGAKAAELGLVTGLCEDVDEVIEKLNENVALQLEAIEEENVEEEALEDEAKMSKISKFMKQAKSLLKPKASTETEDDDDDGEDDGEEPIKQDEESRRVEPKMDMKHLVICDYTGTIKADESGMADNGVIKHLEKMHGGGKKIHIVSGQPESHRAEIADYLKKNNVKHHALHVRPDEEAHNEETKPEYKIEKVAHIKAKTGLDVHHVIEDEEACTEAYEEEGYECHHPEDFHADAKKHAEEAVEDSEKAVETDKSADMSDAKRHRGGALLD